MNVKLTCCIQYENLSQVCSLLYSSTRLKVTYPLDKSYPLIAKLEHERRQPLCTKTEEKEELGVVDSGGLERKIGGWG